MKTTTLGIALAGMFYAIGLQAETITIGNALPLEDWNRAAARVWVYDITQFPPVPFRFLDEELTSGPDASVIDVVAPADGLLSAAAVVAGYNLSGLVETEEAAEGISAAAQIRDQIYVEADFDTDSVLEFEFSLDYFAGIDFEGFAEFQFTLVTQEPDGTFVIHDAPVVDFGLGDGPLFLDTSRTFTVSTAMAGPDDVLITSGTYVPIQLTLVGTVDGTGYLDFLNTLELTDFAVKDEEGNLLGATTASQIDPANPVVNSNPIPEPATMMLLVTASVISFCTCRRKGT